MRVRVVACHGHFATVLHYTTSTWTDLLQEDATEAAGAEGASAV